MSKPALLNVAIIAANIGAAELEFAVKKVHTLDVKKKGPADYTTAIDKRVEKIVLEEIKRFYPDDNFLGEETGEQLGSSNITWVLDPIDGTSNFMHGYPHFCISLSCLIDGSPVAGVIIDPTRQEEFSASKGSGADLNNRKIRVSKQPDLNGSLISNSSHTNSSQPYKYENLKTFQKLYESEVTIRRSGSVALDLCYVAAGRLDAFWGHGLKKWDVSAGLLIAEEAGALISDFNGDPKYLDGDHFICSSPKCFKPMLQAIKPFYKAN